jgi:cytochrome o ubiquinol oxidase subunit 2
LRFILLLPLIGMTSACGAVVLSPSGDVAAQQRDLLLISTGLMLLIILPVMALTVLFAWRYRAKNKDARYEPDWDHSTSLEVVIWAAPLLIIICLGALTWAGTHLLDPYRPLNRIAAGRPVPQSVEPLRVDVVALDWKWLFIYPEYGVATVNELAAPVDRPIQFNITASNVMNTFYVPALAGQIYAMPSMQTKLYAVINKPGQYEGFSANYSGAGFSGMRFAFHGLPQAGFDQWIATARASGETLDRAQYLQLEKPSERVPVRRFGKIDAGLFAAIVGRCVEPGRMCMGEMMALDDQGGVDQDKAVLPLIDRTGQPAFAPFGQRPAYVTAICQPTDPAPGRLSEAGEVADAIKTAPLLGAGLAQPNSPLSRSRPALSMVERPASNS